ncbi:hypothetical protein D9M71_591470 [compost metagenome]
MQGEIGLGFLDLRRAGVAGQLRQARAGLGLVQQVGGGQPALGQMAQAFEVAAIQFRLGAALLAGLALPGEARLGFRDPRLAVVLAQAHQHLAGLHPLALVDQQFGDLATEIERQPRAPAGFQGAGTGVGDQGFHLSPPHFHQPHRLRLRPAPPPEQQAQGDDDQGQSRQLAHARVPLLSASSA